MNTFRRKPGQLGVLRGLNFGLDNDKGADLSVDFDKGADLNLDFDKGADLGVFATSIDSALKPLEALLGRLEYETAVPFAGDSPQALEQLQRFTSDSGGSGVIGLIADIRGYVDELRTAMAEMKAARPAGGSQIVQVNGPRGATIHIVVQ